ncbi:MAG: ABC transporter ATP-binding protein [Candidatus Eremiobacterota bacterium]
MRYTARFYTSRIMTGIFDTDEFKKNILWLYKFYLPLKKRLIAIILLSILVGIVSAAIPYTFITIIDSMQKTLSMKSIIQSIIILCALSIILFFLSALNANKRALTNLELEWQYRQKTFERIIKLDQSFYAKFRTGDVLTRLTDDVGSKLSWFACSGVFRSVESLLRIIFSIIAMFMINPYLAIVAFIPLPLQIVIFTKTREVLTKRFKELQKRISAVNETIETCFSGIRIIQAYCKEQRQAEKFASVAEKRVEAEISAEKGHILVHSLYHHFWQFAQVIVLLTGGWLVINGKLTVGEFVAFDYYIGHLMWPMFDISNLLVGYRRAAVSIKRIRELEEYTCNIKSPEVPVLPEYNNGRIIFNNVTLYKDTRCVLNDISFDTENHRMIAIVGEVGSGKSSLLELICRLVDPPEGDISLDGIPLKKWDLSKLRKKTGYVSQEPLLFTDTVANNIQFGRKWIEKDKILNCADIAGLTEEIKEFSNGFDTSIGLRGMTVSGGQKQRISIARALAGTPEILVLDDSTAHLDAETEKSLWDNIYKVLPDMKVFVVSHRTATLERADIILVLKDGKLAETGKHSELITKKGEYYRIYSKFEE